MSKNRKYLIASITLGAIAASSALLIGLTNLITKDQIIKNENNKINAGIKAIFGDNSSISHTDDINGDYQYLTYQYEVKANDVVVGYAYRTDGSNMYGKISLIIGFEADKFNFIGLEVVTNEQTYASTLEENYLLPLNSGNRDLDDVNCGATYGAKLVRDMVNEAKDYIKENMEN